MKRARKDVMKALRESISMISIRNYSDYRIKYQRVKLYHVAHVESTTKAIREWLAANGHPQVSVESYNKCCMYGFDVDSILICFPHEAYY